MVNERLYGTTGQAGKANSCSTKRLFENPFDTEQVFVIGWAQSRTVVRRTTVL